MAGNWLEPKEEWWPKDELPKEELPKSSDGGGGAGELKCGDGELKPESQLAGFALTLYP